MSANTSNYEEKTDDTETEITVPPPGFPATIVEREIQTILEAFLFRKRYAANRCSRLTKDISSIVRSKVKDILGDRCKLVVQMMMGEDIDDKQIVTMATKCVLNEGESPNDDRERHLAGENIDPRDRIYNFVSCTFRNKHIYAICVVHTVQDRL